MRIVLGIMRVGMGLGLGLGLCCRGFVSLFMFFDLCFDSSGLFLSGNN